MELTAQAFTSVEKYASRAVLIATEKLNIWLASNRDKEVVSVQVQQTTYRDMDGDYPQDMFWVTLLATVRTPAENGVCASDVEKAARQGYYRHE